MTCYTFQSAVYSGLQNIYYGIVWLRTYLLLLLLTCPDSMRFNQQIIHSLENLSHIQSYFETNSTSYKHFSACQAVNIGIGDGRAGVGVLDPPIEIYLGNLKLLGTKFYLFSLLCMDTNRSYYTTVIFETWL